MSLLRGVLASGALAALLVGLPWALIRFIGWPLPDHLPSWAEVEDVLLAPMTTTLLLDILACATWLAWALFALDVVQCTVDLVRNAHTVDVSRVEPIRRVATVLVGALLLSLLGQRAGATPINSPTDRPGSTVVATAPAWPAPRHVGETTTQAITVATHESTVSVSDETALSAPSGPRSVVVRTPENGVHDSLWRIAARTLGDGARWPEIFELNKGRPQPSGRTFTNPSLIFPGEKLTLPGDPIVSPPSQDMSPPTTPPDPTQTPPPALPSSSATPAPSTQHTPETATDTKTPPAAREPGFRWGTELFVGLALAATVSAALVVARRRHNSQYRPGSGDRTQLLLAPVVYQLRLAHLRAEANDTAEDNEFDLDDMAHSDQPNGLLSPTNHGKGERPQHAPRPSTLVVGARDTGLQERPAPAPGLGVRDGREIALDLATARGLGLVGLGAAAATRALLIAALTAATAHPSASPQQATTSVLVPADDLTRLLGRPATHTTLPATLRVVRDLDDALDVLEAEILVRAAAGREPTTAAWRALVLVARPPEHGRQRLQAVLDNGASFGITGLLLGQWQPGVSCYVRADGTISATGPGLGESLRGTQVFRLGDNDTAELLALLQQADHSTQRDTQADTHTGMEAPRHPPRPRIADSEPTESESHGTDPAACPELEILGSHRTTRPRPSATPRQQATTLRKIEDADTPTNASVDGDHKTHHEVYDEPTPPSEHSTTACSLATAATQADHSADTVAVPITIAVLGPLRVHWVPDPSSSNPDQPEQEITGVLQPRTRELLVLLALHPKGITREALVSALWGEDPPARPTNALHTTLSRLRQALVTATNQAVTDVAMVGNGRYQLDPTTVTVDYWCFANAVAARRTATTEHERMDAYRNVINSYSGVLAEGMATEWIESLREAIRRDAIDAVAALARALVETDPQQTLDLLEVARVFDPHNELLYRDIMRLQDRLGQHDAISRTLTLLTTRLAEVDEAPSTQTRGLVARLGQRHDMTDGCITGGTPALAIRLASKRDG